MRSAADRQTRTELRRPRRGEVALFVVHASLDHSAPAIWRRLELRSDLLLSRVHDVLQAAFAWEDRHLHRFSLGGDPFAPDSQLFLCPFDVQEGEDDGLPTDEVRLDEVVSGPDDELAYAYDYGWQITLRLEDVRSPEVTSPLAARALDGERAAPPEGCGRRLTARELADVLPDPARLDLAALDRTVRRSVTVLGQDDFRPELLELLDRATRSPGCEQLVARARQLAVDGPRATRLAAHPHGSYELEATLVLLVHLATSVGGRVHTWAVATVLGGLGWRNQDGGALEGFSVTGLDAWWLLGNVGPMVRTGLPHVSVAAAALARDALRPDADRSEHLAVHAEARFSSI